MCQDSELGDIRITNYCIKFWVSALFWLWLCENIRFFTDNRSNYQQLKITIAIAYYLPSIAHTYSSNKQAAVNNQTDQIFYL